MVWRATHEGLGRPVAVKVLRAELVADPEAAGRFRGEARALASAVHPGIVTVYDFVEDDLAGAVLVMEYIAGEPLSAVLERQGRLPVAYTMDLVAQVGEALHAAHERGIVHRDVKPSNLLIRQG